MRKAKFDIIRKCNICGQPFHAKTLTSVHCSRRCSNAAYRRKKREKSPVMEQSIKVFDFPERREYISVSEAVKLYGVSRNTIYRHIKSGNLPSINMGVRLTRLKRSELETIFNRERVPDCSTESQVLKPAKIQPINYYTLEEIYARYHVSASTVYKAIRSHKIPTRQMGRFILVDKKGIDLLFK